jgi:two-component sensor histidine kinase
MSKIPGRWKWPLATNVIVALALALAPLGVLAVTIALNSFLALDDGDIPLLQAIGIVTPILMWLAALVIAWLLASRLMVRPLMQIRASVDRYTAGDYSVRLRGQPTRSLEVAALALAFDGMADAIARHDIEQQSALIEQQRLTREVHHRVKNNLQIVLSLLSLQARDATTPEVLRAYAIVQSRVAALAVVHRWMYEAAGSVEAGVDLRSLATDLCAELEQSLAASEHLPVHLHCDIAPLYVAQDTAVPIAFLITEFASCAARLTAPAPLHATIIVDVEGTGALLSVCAECFADSDILALSGGDPASRIIHGMARQLRSPLRHDIATGCYHIGFSATATATV